MLQLFFSTTSPPFFCYLIHNITAAVKTSAYVNIIPHQFKIFNEVNFQNSVVNFQITNKPCKNAAIMIQLFQIYNYYLIPVKNLVGQGAM